MDEIYVKMCDCPEIQGQWEPKKWDRTLHYRGRTHVLRSSFIDKHNYLWLPRQEDIQEMWKGTCPDHIDGIPSNWMTMFISCFYDWVMEASYDKSLLFAPIVNLQLAFYMWDVHNKSWTEKGWE